MPGARLAPSLRRASRWAAAGLALALSLCVPLAARADEALLSGPDDPGFEESLEQVGDPDDEGAPAPVGEEPDGAELASALDSYLAGNASQTGVPGIAVAVVDSDGVRYEATLGDCADRHSTFLVGSLSKSMTATAAMRLVEAGRVDLDAPAAEYVGALAPDGVCLMNVVSRDGGADAGFLRAEVATALAVFPIGKTARAVATSARRKPASAPPSRETTFMRQTPSGARAPTYSAAGASRSTRPASTSLIAAVAVIDLERDPTRKVECLSAQSPSVAS